MLRLAHLAHGSSGGTTGGGRSHTHRLLPSGQRFNFAHLPSRQQGRAPAVSFRHSLCDVHRRSLSHVHFNEPSGHFTLAAHFPSWQHCLAPPKRFSHSSFLEQGIGWHSHRLLRSCPLGHGASSTHFPSLHSPHFPSDRHVLLPFLGAHLALPFLKTVLSHGPHFGFLSFEGPVAAIIAKNSGGSLWQIQHGQPASSCDCTKKPPFARQSSL
jgi:hypothetical protein